MVNCIAVSKKTRWLQSVGIARCYVRVYEFEDDNDCRGEWGERGADTTFGKIGKLF